DPAARNPQADTGERLLGAIEDRDVVDLEDGLDRHPRPVAVDPPDGVRFRLNTDPGGRGRRRSTRIGGASLFGEEGLFRGIHELIFLRLRACIARAPRLAKRMRAINTRDIPHAWAMPSG